MHDNYYFCIECFENHHIKDYIAKNGSKNSDEDYSCPFCSSFDPKFIIQSYKIVGILEKALYNLYSYDEENTYDDMCNTAQEYYCDDGENPENFADLISINDLEGLENKPTANFKTIEEIFSDDFGFGHDVYELYKLFDKFKSLKTMSCIYGQKVWKYKCLYTT